MAFFESALQAVDPQHLRRLRAGQARDRGQAQPRHRQGPDRPADRQPVRVGDIAGDFAARADVKDPAAFSKTVDKVAKALPQLGSTLGIQAVRRSGDLYEVRLSGGSSFVFGMARTRWWWAAMPHARTRSRRPAGGRPGASGSLVVSADAEGIARQILAKIAPQFGIPDADRAGVRAPVQRAARLGRQPAPTA